jgi:hypothetical protein
MRPMQAKGTENGHARTSAAALDACTVKSNS